MSSYRFFTAHLRFVANKAEPLTTDAAIMIEALIRIADEIERVGHFTIEYDQVRYTGRALAGVAGFLQQHILPEVVAAKNNFGESQVRWVIDTSMSMLSTLTVHAETKENNEPCRVTLPNISF